MKTFNEFHSINEWVAKHEFELAPLKQQIDTLEQKVRLAHANHGTNSTEYETLFDELHDLRMDYQNQLSDKYKGKLPKPR